MTFDVWLYWSCLSRIARLIKYLDVIVWRHFHSLSSVFSSWAEPASI